MTHFIIIRGPLGSGKSTIAQNLAKRIDARYISIDHELSDRGLDHMSADDECIPQEQFLKLNEALLPEVREAMRLGRSVILDGCFYFKEVIEDLFEKLEFPGKVFTLKVPVEVCIERDRGRATTFGEDAARAVHSLVSRFDYGESMDATQPLDEIINTILEKLQ
ncbi:MAG: ATP-binding protein [Candidatus Uhrbacteria bacterium]